MPNFSLFLALVLLTFGLILVLVYEIRDFDLYDVKMAMGMLSSSIIPSFQSWNTSNTNQSLVYVAKPTVIPVSLLDSSSTNKSLLLFAAKPPLLTVALSNLSNTNKSVLSDAKPILTSVALSRKIGQESLMDKFPAVPPTKMSPVKVLSDGKIFGSLGYTLGRSCLNLASDQIVSSIADMRTNSSTCRVTTQWTKVVNGTDSVNPGSVSAFQCDKSTVVTKGANKKCPHTIYSFREPGTKKKFAMVTRIAQRSCDMLKKFENENCFHLSSRISYCERHSCDLLIFRYVIEPEALRKYPAGWRSATQRNSLSNAVFFAKWDAIQTVLRMGYDWVLFTDLDVVVMNLSASFQPYLRAAEAAGRSAVVVDRPRGLPNAGCAMVRNDAAGRALVDRIVDDWREPWFQEDNGALAHEILRAGVPAANYSRPTRFDLTGIAWGSMAGLGMPFGDRGRHPSVLFLDADAEGRGLPRPFCVRPANAATEPAFAPGDWMLHSYDKAKVHGYGPHLRGAKESCGC
jgi:hypothetical protein